jgi:diguanylate cyclase (GGDEF)-like protein
MESTDGFLKSLATRLESAHVILHAPSLFADYVAPAPATPDVSRISSLTRHVLWPMAQQGGDTQTLNRARVKRGDPVLPYRIVMSPLIVDQRPLGVVAALRTHAQPSFEPTDAATLAGSVADLLELLSSGGNGQTLLLRRPNLAAEIALRSKGHEGVSVVYADLDQLHAINELAGFTAGDEVIRAVGRIWQPPLLPSGSVANRLSGDRYAAVLFNHSLDQARDWAESAREAIERLEIRGHRSRITASFGVAKLTRAGEFEHALAAAETACRAAKDRGRNRVEVYESADVSMMRRHEEVHESRIVIDALDTDRFALHAQPVVTLAAPSTPSHYEILLRLQGLDGVFKSIGEYLKAAERYQLLERIDRWVIERTLRVLAPRAAALRALGVSFAINVTGPSLSEPDFADFVRTAVKEHAIPGALLVFEFTETAAVRNLAATQRFIARMTEIGSKVALDDFGTGLSSLVHLKELAVQQIKIDGQFIRDILTDSRSEALVRALVQIAEQLGLETVAEFVETHEVAAHLRRLGVRYAQGNLYGGARALDDTLVELLAKGAPAAVAAGPSTIGTARIDGVDKRRQAKGESRSRW